MNPETTAMPDLTQPQPTPLLSVSVSVWPVALLLLLLQAAVALALWQNQHAPPHAGGFGESKEVCVSCVSCVV